MKMLVLFFSALMLSPAADLAVVRQKYVAAATSAKEADELYKILESTSNDSPFQTLVAYKGGALALRAKFEKGLLNKKNLFTEGATLLEAVIAENPANYEARVIRLSIQENAPRITGYNKEIDDDKKFIIKNFNIQKADLKEFTKNFIKLSPSFSKEEKAAY